MSCNYAEGLSPYDDKGVLGVPEKFEDRKKVEEKCTILAKWMKSAKHVVFHTGAGISTSAGIPDFRGPNGVWTLEKQGLKPQINISFNDAKPTKTHMALKHLVDRTYVQYIVSQNIDGLHLKTGVPRANIAELHGNMFIGQCDTCNSQFVLNSATTTVGQKYINSDCKRATKGRPCRGRLKDTVLDWEADLPESDLEMSDYHSSVADINVCLGTTLQIVPSGKLPLKCKKYGGKLVIVNLQPTKHDKNADLVINTYVDDVMEQLMKKLGLTIPDYSPDCDPTKYQLTDCVIEWNIFKTHVKNMRKKYDLLNKEFKKRKLLESPKKILVSKKKIKKCKTENFKCEKIEITDELVIEGYVDLTVDDSENEDDDDDIFIE